jgi:hypothetical protein
VLWNYYGLDDFFKLAHECVESLDIRVFVSKVVLGGEMGNRAHFCYYMP